MDEIKKILIVDDRPENLIALEKLLDDFHAEIIRATSGNEALTKTLEHDFALALIDVQMPDMDGYETVKLMRQVDRTRFLPIIFLSAIYSEEHYLIQGIEAGAIDFLTKPIQPRILLGKVKIFLELHDQKKKLEMEIEQRKLTELSLLKTEKQLMEAKIKAEEADKLKSAFLANMSHEIRTPLNAIVGFANLLAEDDLTPEKKEQYLSFIFSSSETLTNIISDILDLAKIEAGQLLIKPAPVDINKILSELKATFDEDLKNRHVENIKLYLKLPDKTFDSMIITDQNRLKQIISNLLQNAFKFTLKGSVEFGYQFIENESLEFFVNDTGIGIAKEKLGLIFDRFQKIDNEKVQNPTGTGLGLSIVKRIVEIFDGKIWVESKPGIGTRFTFSMPVKISSNQPSGNQKDMVVIMPESFDWTSKELLIAEDEYSNYLLLEEILEPTHVKITWARDGREALEIFLNKSPFDVVLMDIKMPVMSGLEAYKELRKLSSDLPIIAQTAYAMTEEEEQFRQIGFNGYLTKPIVKKELLRMLESFLH